MEPFEKSYHLTFGIESRFREMLQRNGYIIKKSGQIYKENQFIGGLICYTVIVNVLHQEGRTLDKLLTEWNPEEKGE